MLKGLMAAIGVGGAKVDTVLDNAEVMVGGTLSGRIRMNGGSVRQRIDRVHLELITLVEHEVDDRTVRKPFVIAPWTTGGAVDLEPGQGIEVPFSLDVPRHTPIYIHGAAIRVWLRTRLQIPGAVDPTDDDPIRAYGSGEMKATFEAMDMLGFRLVKSDVEHRRFGRGFMQEFEFRPARYGTGLDEVEIVFEPTDQGVDLLVQVDRAARGWAGYWAESLGFDESWHRVAVPFGADARRIADIIRAILP